MRRRRRADWGGLATHPAGSLSSAATSMPTRGRASDEFSTETRKMGIVGASIVGQAASCEGVAYSPFFSLLAVW